MKQAARGREWGKRGTLRGSGLGEEGGGQESREMVEAMRPLRPRELGAEERGEAERTEDWNTSK